jgi:esterase/lipase superfamily enzyme
MLIMLRDMILRLLELRDGHRHDEFVESDDSLKIPAFSPVTGQLVEQIQQPLQKHEVTEAAEDAPGGRALLFVHGFGVSRESAAAMTQKVSSMLQANGRVYNETVAVVWDARGPFFQAEQRADDTGEQALREEVERLHHNGFEVDVVGHSLGCRPVLACLRALSLSMDGDSDPIVKNAVLLAGAVRDETLDEGKAHHFSPVAAEYVYVAHSNRDMVINGLFRLARFTGGLGGGGPERFWKRFDDEAEQLILENIVVVDCVETIPDHGDYFQEEHGARVFAWIARDMGRPSIDGGPWGHRIEG